MATLKSRLQHSITPAALRAYFAEFISTFIYVFAAVGTAMSSRKLSSGMDSEVSCLTAISLASAFALSVAVFIAVNISGGHVNPAVTFGVAIGGRLSFPMAIFYWISQILGSVMACILLKTATIGAKMSLHPIPSEMTGFGAGLLEGVMTFGLVYTVYASSDPRRGGGAINEGTGPILVGLIVGANVLASGPFTGGSMNPAFSFGVAIAEGSFQNQAVYWVGPLIGAGVAAIMYENLMFPYPESTIPDN